MKYKLPDGTETSESGFETKTAALNWGRDQEANIRSGRWTDPNAGKLTVSEWIERWLAVQDVSISTVDSREYLIRRFIRPAWGNTALSDLSTEEITKWEKALPDREGITPRTARAARTLLGTILGDAAATRPPLIPYNPALRPRNRGRRTGRRLQRAPQRIWATPLQVLLIAERAALLTGRDEDFTMILTIGYTGLRWAEAIGLEHEYTRPQQIHVEWQLRELRGRFYRLPPKDDSYRSPDWDPGLPVDLPPFLAELLKTQVKDHPRQPCSCASQHEGSGRYVFLGPDGGHYRRSNYSRRVFRPACDGRHLPIARAPGRLVIADQTTTWPGTPIAAWPPATETHRPGRRIPAAPRPRHRDHPGRHPARLLAPDQARPDPARPKAQPQDLDGRGRHARDPGRAATRPPGARHARPLHPRLRTDARRANPGPPSHGGRNPSKNAPPSTRARRCHCWTSC